MNVPVIFPTVTVAFCKTPSTTKPVSAMYKMASTSLLAASVSVEVAITTDKSTITLPCLMEKIFFYMPSFYAFLKFLMIQTNTIFLTNNNFSNNFSNNYSNNYSYNNLSYNNSCNKCLNNFSNNHFNNYSYNNFSYNSSKNF